MSSVSINHLSNQELAFLFTFLPTSDLQFVSHRWMNICTTYFAKKYHLILENVTLNNFSSPVQVFKSSNKVIETLTLSNVDLDFSDGTNFSEVLLFLKRLQATVIELKLHYSIKPNIDLIRGFNKVEIIEITAPSWYAEIANSKISFPEVRVLKLTDFNIEIFGKNMFCSFFKKFSYVEEIEIEGNVIQNYSQFGTFFGKKLKKVHFDIDNDQLATKTMEFLTIIKGIELHQLTFVVRTSYDVEILERLVMVHATLQEINVISTQGHLPRPHSSICSMKITLKDEILDVFNALDAFSGLKSIKIDFPLKMSHVQINCFFGHDFFEEHFSVKTLKLSGFNKDCIPCFINMTSTYRNLQVFQYHSATQIDLDIIKIIGSNLIRLEELTLSYKTYEKSTEPGFAKYFEEWPSMNNIKILKLEPISWQWSFSGLVNLCEMCPILEKINFDGGADIDEHFLQPIMTRLPFLQDLTIGETNARPSVLPNLPFLFEEDIVEDCYQNMELIETFKQPCPRLKELRLMTCSLDMSLKLRLFHNFSRLKVVQDRKTLLTSKEFHEMREQFHQDIYPVVQKEQKAVTKVKKLLHSCFC